jgi:hypothetical protein
MKHKLMQVMLEREQERLLAERVEADDAYMGGVAHGGKRGRGAAHKRPFLAAVQTTLDRHPHLLDLQALKRVTKRAVLRWGKSHLHPKTRVVTDGWPAYRSLQAHGWKLEVRIPKSKGWRKAKHPAFRWVNTIIGNLKGNILGVCRAIRLKHLPRYLAEFQYRFNRRYHLKNILPQLLTDATAAPPMPYRLLKLAEVGW